MAKSARNLDAPGDSELIRTEFCLLGPVSAWVGGVAVPVGGPRQAAVLARMLLTPRQVVSLDQFIDCIWDGQIPNRPEVAIRSYVSNLRRLLEPERKDRGTNSALASASAGYRLDVDSGQIDWIRYEGSVNEARGQLKSGLFDQAESSLRFAEDLWRGEPLTGVPESEFFLAHRNRLEELRAVAQELTYEAKLALGDHLSVAADIDQAISANPFRERLTELGMIALYRSGRQSAALALGQQLRERLVDSLGIDPSPHINNIELQILTHDPALREQPAPPPRSPSTGAAHPSPVEVTDPGSTNGPRPPSEPTHEIATAERSPLLRRPGDDQLLFGRQGEFGELQRLGQRLDRKLMAVAVVTGEPGVGKTVLLERAAIELAGNGGRIVRCAGTDFAGPKFWLWRQLIDDLVVEPSTPLQSPAISDTTGLEPLQALGLRVGPDGIRPDRSGVPRPASSFGDDEIMVAIGDLVDRVAAQSPLVIIVDDLHLADQRSVDTLRYLVTKPNKPAITVLIAWQQVLLPPEQPRGLRELSVLPHGLRISLRGIDEAAVRRLAAFRGHELSDAEVGRLHRSAGGNPALTIETLTSGLLADDEVSGTSARTVGSTPNLTEAVVGQASQIGVDASPILAVAGIFDGPFALSWLEDVVESPADGGPRTQPIAPGRCRDVVREAVYRGLLIELPEFGWFAFRHQIVRRTLAESLLLMDRAWYHGHFGRRFLQAGDMGHALYHLAQGSDQQDRRTALDIGLQLCSSLSDNLPVGDSTLRTLETLAREQIKGVGDSRLVSPLACRSALFLGWRANQRGDRATGRRWSHTALEAALTAVGTTNRRRKSAAPATALADLSAAALNLTGFSPHPLPGGQLNVERDDTSLNLLERAVSQLPNDDEALPVLEIELEWLTGSLLPSNASLNKATSLLEQALKSPTTSVAAMATTIYLRRFGRAIASERWVELIRTAITVQTTTGERLMLGFLEHRAMLELGLVDEAAGIIRTLGNSCERSGTRADATAARTLAIRHHLWTGDLQSAERLLDRPAEAEPAGADLVAVEVEQRAELGRLLARGDLLADASDELGRSTVDPATGAALLSQAGDYDRAAELLDQALKRLSTGRHQQIDEATLARVAMTASILLHKAAAAAVLEPLRSLGDEILVSSNSAVLLGPASFFTGLAAAVIEDRSLANEALDAAVAASLSKGGKPLAIQALIAQAKLAADYSDRDDVESLLRQAKELAVGLDIHWLDTQVV